MESPLPLQDRSPLPSSAVFSLLQSELKGGTAVRNPRQGMLTSLSSSLMRDDRDCNLVEGAPQHRGVRKAARSTHPAGRCDAMLTRRGGGKRVRALLAYAAGEFTNADPAVVDAPAAAVELIHAYSLIHDDLPAMDNDTLRRGKPTCHVAFGEATALLAGDALQSIAFGVLGASALHEPGAACALLAHAAGADGMAGGQAIDPRSRGEVAHRWRRSKTCTCARPAP